MCLAMASPKLGAARRPHPAICRATPCQVSGTATYTPCNSKAKTCPQLLVLLRSSASCQGTDDHSLVKRENFEAGLGFFAWFALLSSFWLSRSRLFGAMDAVLVIDVGTGVFDGSGDVLRLSVRSWERGPAKAHWRKVKDRCPLGMSK